MFRSLSRSGELNKMSKLWIEQPRNIDTSSDIEILIDDTFEKIETIPGLKTSLFPHQKPIIKAMIDLEMTRTIKAKRGYNNNEVYEIKTTAGVLSEAVGSGKTIDILSLILVQKIPKVFPEIADINLLDDDTCYRRFTSLCYTSVVRKRFRSILKPTLIFAGVSVVDQWVKSIQTFTSLKYFKVFDVRDLQQLINFMENKKINQYDIVIVKNGKITRPINFPPSIIIEDKNRDKTTLYIYNVLANMRNYSWARVVVDDFDTISLPHNAGVVNSLFTWYISSTKKNMTNKVITNKQFKTTSELLMYNNYSCSEIMKNKILFTTFNIRNNPDFVQRTNNLSSPAFYAYVFENINNKYMGLLGAMGNAESVEIMEMLNGDAIETAAVRLGIKTDSVADIFENMLGKQYELYKKAVFVLDFIKEVEPMQGLRKAMSENPDDHDTYKKSDILIGRPIEYNYPNLKGLIDATKEEYTDVKKKSGIAIERVKSNITHGECPVCYGELSDEGNIIILKCCGIILCGICCFGTVFANKSPVGKCIKCRNQINLKTLIYVNSNFNLNKIVEDKLDYEIKDELKFTEKNVNRSKIDAIVDIIKGVRPPEQRKIDVNINNLMKGTNQLPKSPFNKVLIFANYTETIDKIMSKLVEEKIDYWQLHGTHSEITTTVDKFTKCTERCVLIVNSTKHCAGLNLQTATDLIFAHKMVDPNIETQVIGRGQRIGRTSQLRVHFMFYQNEYDWMLNMNSLREVPDN